MFIWKARKFCSKNFCSDDIFSIPMTFFQTNFDQYPLLTWHVCSTELCFIIICWNFYFHIICPNNFCFNGICSKNFCFHVIWFHLNDIHSNDIHSNDIHSNDIHSNDIQSFDVCPNKFCSVNTFLLTPLEMTFCQAALVSNSKCSNYLL